MKFVVALAIFTILAVCVRGQNRDGADEDNVEELRERVSNLISNSELASRATGNAASVLERVLERFRTLAKDPERTATARDVLSEAGSVIERVAGNLRALTENKSNSNNRG